MHRAKYEDFCRSLQKDELALPVPNSTWIVKDFISHLATIDGPVETMFRNVHTGAGGAFERSGDEKWNVDSWNDHMVEVRRDKSVDEILAEAAATRATLRQAMSDFTQKDLDYEMVFGGDSKRPAGKVLLGQYLRGWCKHDPMHAVDMMRAMPGRMTPELAAWFDDPVIAGYQAQMNKA
ncbi:hypothetical protein AYO38_04015 [bacterium SCGC AG-212-C10]|nr:hypothetical protein AYO38_04015 [bacterium SCGC AG-212-C10]